MTHNFFLNWKLNNDVDMVTLFLVKFEMKIDLLSNGKLEKMVVGSCELGE